MNEPLRLGVSACLLGRKVRYDGQHKRDAFVADTLARLVEFVPVCPEVECGLPVPREAMRLVGDPCAPRLMTQRTGIDHTARMYDWTLRRIEELARENLCGFIFKARSPSSGMERVKVYDAHGGTVGRAPGLFARAFMERFPLLPVEDEGRLKDIDLRENFIERIFTLRRYRTDVRPAPTLRRLMLFHERHKFLIQAHDSTRARRMGAKLASVGAQDAKDFAGDYERMLLEALSMKATVSKHVDVLQHMLGFFKKLLSADEKAEMLEVIGHYRHGMLPLIVPVTLMRHYVRKHNVVYLAGQFYLEPHPLELKLRNHA